MMSSTSMISEKTLSGKLQAESGISGKLSEEIDIKGSLILPIGYEDYAGPYSVKPKTEPYLLATADRHMTDDVTIDAIPYYEVSNQNGKTIIIGGN